MSVITEPSICIPRTLNNVTWMQVKNTFEALLGKGTVERVDIVSKSASAEPQPFCRIFVHFRYWPNTPEITAIRDRLVAGEMIKVVYDNPWFWKCAASRVPKPTKNVPRTAPFVEFMPQEQTKTQTNEGTNVAMADSSAGDGGNGSGVGEDDGNSLRCESPPPLRRSYTVASKAATAGEPEGFSDS